MHILSKRPSGPVPRWCEPVTATTGQWTSEACVRGRWRSGRQNVQNGLAEGRATGSGATQDSRSGLSRSHRSASRCRAHDRRHRAGRHSVVSGPEHPFIVGCLTNRRSDHMSAQQLHEVREMSLDDSHPLPRRQRKRWRDRGRRQLHGHHTKEHRNQHVHKFDHQRIINLVDIANTRASCSIRKCSPICRTGLPGRTRHMDRA